MVENSMPMGNLPWTWTRIDGQCRTTFPKNVREYMNIQPYSRILWRWIKRHGDDGNEFLIHVRIKK